MGSVVVPLGNDMQRIIAAAGGDPDNAGFDPGTLTLTVGGVDGATLQAAADGVINGTATPSAQDVVYKIKKLSEACREDLLDGFQSSAIGSSLWYDSSAEDQGNLVGAVTADEVDYYPCRAAKGNPKTYVMHTAAELLQVLRDGKAVKLMAMQAFETKRAQALAATTLAELNAIGWP